MATACARHILVNTLEEAEKLKKLIDQGQDLGKLAKKHSLCPTRKRGGDLGEFSQGQMVPAFDNVVFNMPVLEVHGPVKTKFGYHIIQTIYRT